MLSTGIMGIGKAQPCAPTRAMASDSGLMQRAKVCRVDPERGSSQFGKAHNNGHLTRVPR